VAHDVGGQRTERVRAARVGDDTGAGKGVGAGFNRLGRLGGQIVDDAVIGGLFGHDNLGRGELLGGSKQSGQDGQGADGVVVGLRGGLLVMKLATAAVHVFGQARDAAIDARGALVPLGVAHFAQRGQPPVQIGQLAAYGLFGRGQPPRVAPLGARQSRARLAAQPARLGRGLQIAKVDRQGEGLPVGCQHGAVAGQNPAPGRFEGHRLFARLRGETAKTRAVGKLQLHGTQQHDHQCRGVESQNPPQPMPRA
jgi:hypothetical protein